MRQLYGLIKSAVDVYVNGSMKPQNIAINIPKHEGHGEFSSNIAYELSHTVRKPPFEIASDLKTIIEKAAGAINIIKSIEVVKPGYLNFVMTELFWIDSLDDIITQGERYGLNTIGNGKSVLIEFVSANPTGPIHIGHGRGAVVGDVLSRLFSASGYNVKKEYYINDAGNQVLSLGYSVLDNYYKINNIDKKIPDGEYKGEYIEDISKKLELSIQKTQIDEAHINTITGIAADLILNGIKQTLKDFGIEFDNWFSEKNLFEKGSVDAVINMLEAKDAIKTEDGAKWFLSTHYGDEKDRVIEKQSGELTYFASDIAYHADKYDRGFDLLINVWGADHHGYLPRIKAALNALGYDAEKLRVMFIQMVRLMRGDVPVQMSKRSGEYVTLKELISEVGTDAARFFFLLRRHDSQLTFDIELAKKQSQDNPVYYVQYAYARISNIFEYAVSKGIDTENLVLDRDYRFNDQEKSLIRACMLYPDIVRDAAVTMEPHKIAHYLLDLVGLLHKYYTDTRVVSDDVNTIQRLLLIKMIKVVLRNALGIIGVSAPEKM